MKAGHFSYIIQRKKTHLFFGGCYANNDPACRGRLRFAPGARGAVCPRGLPGDRGRIRARGKGKTEQRSAGRSAGRWPPGRRRGHALPCMAGGRRAEADPVPHGKGRGAGCSTRAGLRWKRLCDQALSDAGAAFPCPRPIAQREAPDRSARQIYRRRE